MRLSERFKVISKTNLSEYNYNVDYMNELLIREQEIQERNKQIRTAILKAEMAFKSLPKHMENDCFPLEHTFVDGAYIRKITMPKGAFLTSKIHKVCHPYFVMKGDVSVLTEIGVVRIKAPYAGITPTGTKRLLYIHEETEWITVHVTKKKNLKKIEKEIIATSFYELGLEVDEKAMVEFYNKIKQEELCLG